MLKAGMLGMSLVVAAAEPLLGEVDLAKYALTQGGLLIVVLVLIWLQRRDNERISKKDEEKIVVLTDLVRASTVAMTHAAEASIASEKANHRLARAVERLEAKS